MGRKKKNEKQFDLDKIAEYVSSKLLDNLKLFYKQLMFEDFRKTLDFYERSAGEKIELQKLEKLEPLLYYLYVKINPNLTDLKLYLEIVKMLEYNTNKIAVKDGRKVKVIDKPKRISKDLKVLNSSDVLKFRKNLKRKLVKDSRSKLKEISNV